jgi:hypothetical protein
MIGENICDILVCVSELTDYIIGYEYIIWASGGSFVSGKHIEHIWLKNDETHPRKLLQVGCTHPYMICWTEHFTTNEQYIRNQKLEELISNTD